MTESYFGNEQEVTLTIYITYSKTYTQTENVSSYTILKNGYCDYSEILSKNQYSQIVTGIYTNPHTLKNTPISRIIKMKAAKNSSFIP